MKNLTLFFATNVVLGAFCIGIISTVVCFFMVAVVKEKFKYDDALDAFGALYGDWQQLWIQVVATVVSIIYSIIVTCIIFKVVDKSVGVRVDKRVESMVKVRIVTNCDFHRSAYNDRLNA